MANGTPRPVKVLPCPMPAPAATASDPPITLKVQTKNWQVTTCKPASFLVTISLYLHNFLNTKPVLRYCKGCKTFHSRGTLCFPPDVMDYQQLLTLKDLLDGDLIFTWNNDNHLIVFSLCRFFLLDEQYILPMFNASLRIRYAFSYHDYNVIRLIYEVQDAAYCALAGILADWLALHFPLSCMCYEVLPLANFLQSYDAFCHFIHRRGCMYLRGQGTLPPVKFLYHVDDFVTGGTPTSLLNRE